MVARRSGGISCGPNSVRCAARSRLRAVVEEDGSAAGEDEGWDAAGEKLG